MVKAGELGGVLEVVLTRLAEFQEKAAKIRNKVKAAMVYPIIVMFMAVAIMVFLLVFIVPKFEQIFHDMLGDKPLPGVTLFVIGASRFVQDHWLDPHRRYRRYPSQVTSLPTARAAAAPTSTGCKLRMPLFGDLLRKTAISRFSRTLGTLVTSGVPILQALNITRETAGNLVIANAISQVHDSVKEGESIVQPLEASGAFPPMVISMIDVGEETGQLPEMLLKVADVYDDEVDNSVAGSDFDAGADHDRFPRARRRHHRDRAFHAAHQHHQRPAAANVREETSNFEFRISNFRECGAFTIMELLLVITIIIVLAGLILGTVGYAQSKAARSRASAEIAALSAAIENYKADNGAYPTATPTNNLDARTMGNPTDVKYTDASLVLYRALSGDRDINGRVDVSDESFDIDGTSLPTSLTELPKAYFTFKPQMLSTQKDGSGNVSKIFFIKDPFGNSYGYSTAYQGDLAAGTNPPQKGYNPTFDLWSTGGVTSSTTTSTNQSKWLKTW